MTQKLESNTISGIAKHYKDGIYFLTVKMGDTWKLVSNLKDKEGMDEDISKFIHEKFPYEELTSNEETDMIRQGYIELISNFPKGLFHEDNKWGNLDSHIKSIGNVLKHIWNGKHYVYVFAFDEYDYISYPEAVSVNSTKEQSEKDIEAYIDNLVESQLPTGQSKKLLMEKFAAAKTIELEEDNDSILILHNRINKEHPNKELVY